MVVRSYFRGIALAAAFALFAFAVSACGGGREPSVAPVGRGLRAPPATTPAETTLDEALAELDALETPEGVDESLFAELKDALREALVHGVGARHAVPLREEEALLRRVGRGFIPAASETTEGIPAEEGTARLKSRPTQGIKIVSTPPEGPKGKVEDLTATREGDNFALTWSYRNTGDYNQDGIVNIMDITPLAAHFNEPADESNEWVDGNADGAITILDVTPLAAAFLNEVADYLIEGATSIEGPFTGIESILVSEAEGVGETQARFQYTLDLGENGYFQVVARDGEGTRGEPSNVVGLALEILSVAPTEVKEGTVVTFTAEVVGAGPLTYEWDFAGQTVPPTSTEASPKVVLTREVGDFPASLTVTSPASTITHNFTLYKLARQWVCEMILREAEDSPSAGGLEEFGDRLYFLVSLWPPGAFEPRVRYLVSGNPGNWELEEVDCTGYTAALELTSQSTPAILSCVGPFMDYDLTFSEKVGGSWQAQAIVEGLELPTGTFAFARDDVPFVAYKFRYWEPEETVDIRFARRVNGQWLHGVLDDAGGPGGYADRPIMRLDPDGNPAVAYRVEVGNDPWGNLLYEYRLARWNPETEDWDKQVVKPLGDFRFDPEGRLCLISGGYGSEPDTIALIYARLNGDTWEEDVIEEWPTGEKQPQGYDLAYDALGNPIVAYDSSGYRLFVAWSNGDNWEVAQVASGSGMFADLLVTEKGTPCLVYADDDTKEVILARYE